MEPSTTHAGAGTPRSTVPTSDFLSQQARYRRSGWRLTALAALGVCLMGAPLSIVISPIVWSAVVLAVDVANVVTRAPNVGAIMFGTLDRVLGSHRAVATRDIVALTIAMIAPGVALMAAAWFGARALLLRAGPAGVLLGLGAREPRAGELEEHQLVNIVGEMAIAAGIAAPPRVVVLDTPAINAGAVGTGAADAVMIVSRGLIDRLDRDETQGVIAHVLASIGQGDLRASLMLLTIPQTLGLVATMIGAPVGRAARHALWTLITLAIGRRNDRDAAAQVCELLAANADDMADVDESPTGKTRLRDVLRLPFIMGQAAFWMSQKIALWLFVGPLIALVFRARRYLADATAVQLTRYPDGLARALVRIAGQDDVIPGAEWSTHFFIVGAGAGKGHGGSAPGEAFGSIVSLDPPIARRLRHLREAGATVEEPASRHRLGGRALALLLAIGIPLGLFLAVLMLVAATALIYVSLAIDMLFLLPPVGGLHLLLRHLAG